MIAKEASHRQQVADTVATIVEKLSNDFNEIVYALDTINQSMSSADLAINDIS